METAAMDSLLLLQFPAGAGDFVLCAGSEFLTIVVGPPVLFDLDPACLENVSGGFTECPPPRLAGATGRPYASTPGV
jgi:hypothetical protein